MVINCYSIKQDYMSTYCIDKSPELLVENVNCFMLEGCDVANPVIDIDVDIFTDAVAKKVNYFNIPSLGRWYFLVGKTYPTSDIIRYTLHCDVLRSFYKKLENVQFVSRFSKDDNPYFVDSMRPLSTRKRLSTLQFPEDGGMNLSTASPSSSRNFVLAVSGGRSIEPQTEGVNE